MVIQVFIVIILLSRSGAPNQMFCLPTLSHCWFQVQVFAVPEFQFVSGKHVISLGVYSFLLCSLQDCYWSGKTTQGHDKSSHFMEEYCLPVSPLLILVPVPLSCSPSPPVLQQEDSSSFVRSLTTGRPKKAHRAIPSQELFSKSQESKQVFTDADQVRRQLRESALNSLSAKTR